MAFNLKKRLSKLKKWNFFKYIIFYFASKHALRLFQISNPSTHYHSYIHTYIHWFF